jgi:putative sterol carrier protein
MTNPTTEFLEELGRRGYLNLFENTKGSLRLDLTHDGNTDNWLVEADNGRVRVSRSRADADCVIRSDRAFFDRIVTGEAHALSGLLRGMIEIEGDLHLALVLGRALPGPPQSRWRGDRQAHQTRERRR